MDRGTWRATVHGVTKESDTTARLTSNPHLFDTSMLLIFFVPQGGAAAGGGPTICVVVVSSPRQVLLCITDLPNL